MTGGAAPPCHADYCGEHQGGLIKLGHITLYAAYLSNFYLFITTSQSSFIMRPW